ncbi:hypothetical protein [Propionivibrio limicola]|uniref:hypothetical protein n=1 Tax=Propionivibrio limicola TaxID=167645 RepID=UPI0012909F1D|nr:hypothetical protein [Propionivibrio limicola]
MPKKLRNTQLQLAFPEGELPPTPSSASEAKASAAEGIKATPEATPRKRGIPPKMVLVTEAPKAPVSNAERPLIDALPAGEEAVTSREEATLPVTVSPTANRAENSATIREPVVPSASLELSETPCEEKPAPIVANSSSGMATRFQLGAYVATILASVTVVVALSVGTDQFIETQKSQRALLAIQKSALNQERNAKAAELNSRAVELFLKYNELMLQVNASASKNAKKETRYWKEHLAVNLLESLFNLTRGNREWENTISWTLERHGRFIQSQRLSCATYSNDFVAYLEKSFGANSVALCKNALGSE